MPRKTCEFIETSAHTQLAVWQRGTGFPILCLHGHPGSGESMAVFTDFLSQRFRTIAPDLRGYGKSRTKTAFQMSDHLPDLEAILDHYQIPQCLVLGWSLGGILAMELALRQPHRVRGLILVATAARPRGNHPPITWQDNAYTGVASILNKLQPGAQWTIDWLGKRSLYRYLIQQHTPLAYHYLAEAALPAYLQTSNAAHQALNAALQKRYDRLEAIEQIQCPSLVLAGSCDRHITAASSLETAQHLQKSEWNCYENVAHLFPWEISHRVLHDINDWLDRHPECYS